MRTDYFGESVAAPTPQLARHKGVAVIWQDLALFPEMTVAENIAFDGLVGAPRLVNYRAIRETARAALGKLGVELDLSAPLRSLPISGRQLVAIARALASDAQLIFMDEPTASLTQSETDRLLAVVRTLSRLWLRCGFCESSARGGARRVEPRTRSTRWTTGGRVRRCGMTQSRLTELMTGKRFDQAVTARDVGDAPIVVETSGLTRQGEYEDVNLTLRAGEVVSLIGLIGADLAPNSRIRYSACLDTTQARSACPAQSSPSRAIAKRLPRGSPTSPRTASRSDWCSRNPSPTTPLSRP